MCRDSFGIADQASVIDVHRTVAVEGLEEARPANQVTNENVERKVPIDLALSFDSHRTGNLQTDSRGTQRRDSSRFKDGARHLLPIDHTVAPGKADSQ